MRYPLITLALSVYNVESYLRQSLETIINQTYQNLEILCIDDCSKDKTFDILQEYAQKYSCIKLVKQPKNQGLSVSRNRAIELAQGEYILMLDGDDLFALDMVEKAYTKAAKTDADLVMWDYCAFYRDEDLPQLLNKPSDLIGFEPKDKIALLKCPAFTCLKLIRTQVLRDHSVHFPEGLTKQDIPVWWHLVTVLDKVAVLPERLSYYRQNPFNTTSRKDKSVYSLAYVMDITGEYLKRNNLYATYKDEYLRSRLGLLQGMYDYIKPELQPDAMQMIRERLDTDAIAYINSPACALSKRTNLFYKGYMMGNLLAKLQYDSLMLARTIYRKIKI
ncbi:glycosyltransferase family A protein [uncultured Bacteroides sp.]|uniref:glycosyltransferase family 2 protein n=1 Tax=uncultured Bacteroides sp. TaxID=162156 RepID=UPI00280BAEC2|nr:glycosyltransferase family A protein [uncultured Bacteroides sp.]